MYVQHLTLQTGHLTRIQQGDVAGETLARVRPWLSALVTGGAAPLPVSELADYSATATVLDGALLVTISGRPVPGNDGLPPLVTIGVARRSRHSSVLWPLLTGPVMPQAAPGLRRPGEPWCGVVLWPTMALEPDAVPWLGDLERCIAWAWVTMPTEGGLE